MKNKEIKVCSNCQFPLLWTFLYQGAEYYCLNCQSSVGMLEAGGDVPVTTELKAKYRVAKDVFGALRKHLLGGGRFTRDTCKKCRDGIDQYHGSHLTEKEIQQDKVADLFLDKLALPLPDK